MDLLVKLHVVCYRLEDFLLPFGASITNFCQTRTYFKQTQTIYMPVTKGYTQKKQVHIIIVSLNNKTDISFFFPRLNRVGF